MNDLTKQFNSVFANSCIGEFVLVIAIGSFFITADSYASDYLYRYKDEKGTVVIDQSIPPDDVKRGYTILNKGGTVHKIIPPAMTDEERKQKKLAIVEREKEHAQAKLQSASDAQLLRTFSRAEDAERARDRKLAALDVIIDITKGNMLRLRMEYENDESRAASLERAGSKVPKAVLSNLASLGRQIEDSELFVKEKEKEKEQVTAVFEQTIYRLKELTGG